MTWKSFLFSRRAEIRKISMGKSFQRRSKNTKLLKLVPLQWWNKKQKNIVVSNLKWKKPSMLVLKNVTIFVSVWAQEKCERQNLRLPWKYRLTFFIYTHQKMPSLDIELIFFYCSHCKMIINNFYSHSLENRKSGDLLLMIK